MARWQPDAARRLQRAALDLFAEHGYEQTTAADIAAAVGLTERTFFRYFGDKREVLFFGQQEFEQEFLTGLTEVADEATPMTAVTAAVRAGAAMFTEDRRSFARQRQRVIDANASLQERERHKLAGLAGSIASALRGRGVEELTATLAAESAITVFAAAFAQWIKEGEARPLGDIVTNVFAELAALA